MLEEDGLGSASYEETQYRSVSSVAIVAFGLGWASALALAHPLMWWLPIVAIMVALVASRSIRQSHGALTGQGLTIAAVCLSVFFLSWAVTRAYAGQRIQHQQARTIGERWFEVVKRGDNYRAHQWTMSPFARQRSGVSLNEFYAGNADARQNFEKFEKRVLSTLTGLEADDEVEYQSVSVSEGGPNRRFIQMVFHWRHGQGDVRPIKIGVERRVEGEGGLVLWQVLSVEPAT